LHDDTTEWIKTAGSGSACVEIRKVDGTIEVRDGKLGDLGPVLRFTRDEWAAWLDGAKSGEFDHLT
jgi:hypothetical protein